MQYSVPYRANQVGLDLQIDESTLLVNIAADEVAIDVVFGIARARVLAVVFQPVAVTGQSDKAFEHS